MNNLPVPPNATPAAANLLRGPEPDIVMNVAHIILHCAPSMLKPIVCVTAGPNYRRVQNSNMLLLLGDSLFISNPVGLTFSVALHGVPPQRLHTLWERLVIDGFDTARVYPNAGEFLVEAARIVDALDCDTLHPDYIFDPLEVIDKEPPTNVQGLITVNQLVATSWTRELSFRDLSTPRPSLLHPDLHQTHVYGSFSYYTPATYTSLTRDVAGSANRVAMEEFRAQAEQLRISNAAVTALNQGAARAVGMFFTMTASSPETAVYPDLGARDDFARRSADLATRGMLASSNALAFRATIAAQLHLMSAAVPHLLALFVPLPPAALRLQLLDKCRSNPTGDRLPDTFKTTHDLMQLDALVAPRLPAIAAWAATQVAIRPTASQRVDRFLFVLDAEKSAERAASRGNINAGANGGGGGGGGGGTSGGSALGPGSSASSKELAALFNRDPYLPMARAARRLSPRLVPGALTPASPRASSRARPSPSYASSPWASKSTPRRCPRTSSSSPRAHSR